jgi:transposase-like protein
MTYSDLNNPIFQDADKAREYLEAQRWPNGPVCPHCGSGDEDVYKLGGSGHRPGLFACKGCRGHFSVTVGTVYERSHIPLNKWLLQRIDKQRIGALNYALRVTRRLLGSSG